MGYNAPPDKPCRILFDDGSDLTGAHIASETFPVVDQYTLQGDAFSRMILGEDNQEFGLEDAIANMRVLDALTRSGGTGQWEPV